VLLLLLYVSGTYLCVPVRDKQRWLSVSAVVKQKRVYHGFLKSQVSNVGVVCQAGTCCDRKHRKYNHLVQLSQVARVAHLFYFACLLKTCS